MEENITIPKAWATRLGDYVESLEKALEKGNNTQVRIKAGALM